MQMLENGCLYPSYTLFPDTVLYRCFPKMHQRGNNIAYDRFRTTNAVITGKFHHILASDTTKFCPDVQAMVLIRKKSSCIYDISNVVCRR